MALTYIIEQKRAGQFGYSDFLMVDGTHVPITKGKLHVWNAEREGRLATVAVVSIALERVVSFKSHSSEIQDSKVAHSQVA